jgi:hypothetical protein
MNDILAIFSVLLRVACYVYALILIVRYPQNRKTGLTLAAAYLVAGAICLGLLPIVTGAHYDYWDVGFWTNGRLEFPNMDLNFILIHFGFAVCLSWFIAKLIMAKAHSRYLWSCPIPIAIAAEALFRIQRYKGMLFNSDFDDYVLLLKEIVASFGPPFFAGIGVMVTALVIKKHYRPAALDN